jgi:pimeloyl-ACP methyl ester carboxylesterase
MPICQLPDATLFYAERGQGEALVFLNGLSGDHLYWAGQLRTFSKHYRCLAVDNRDVGRSSLASGPYTTRDLACDVAVLLEQARVPAAHVIGLSMGGMIAQELALARPDLVRSLLLVNTLARSDDWFRGTLRAFALIRRQVPDTPAFFDAILPWWVSHRFLENEDRTAWLRWLLQQNPHPQPLDGFLRQLDALAHHDALDRLPLVRCPVLILGGEDDCVCPPRYSRQAHEHMPHAELVLLPGVGHAAPIEDPAQFNGHLARFLANQSSPLRKHA